MSQSKLKQLESSVGHEGVRQATIARDSFAIRLMRMLPFDQDEVNALALDTKRIPGVLSQKLEATGDNRIRMIINGMRVYYHSFLHSMMENPQ